MSKFLLQLECNGHYSEDTAVVERIIREQNWLHSDCEPIIFNSCHFEQITKESASNVIPVGSIEFINKVLEIGYSVGPVKPTNIPSELFNSYFLGRRADIVKNKTDIKKLYLQWNVDKLFVKSNAALKTGYTDIYKCTDNLPDDTEYFVSEPVDLVSEWRCFVYRGNLKGIKHYCGDPWLLPNRAFVEEGIARLKNRIPAYTLDVGVISPDGKTVVVEVHNFVACGLYGFERPSILPMLVNGIKTEINNTERK